MRRIERLGIVGVVGALLLAQSVAASGHGFDHTYPEFASQPVPSSSSILSGPGDWNLIASIPTGNPHTDLDFFTQDGERFVSVGTLAASANAGGQTIVQLTQGGVVDPAYVSGFGSASCVNAPSSATGLQHDVEATPKGDVLFTTTFPQADRRDAQILIDATDANFRCHDNGNLSLTGAPDGGIEIIDITDVTSPVEIGLISMYGDTHTLNIDAKRSHIAFNAGQDEVIVAQRRSEDNPGGTEDSNGGFHLIDLSSCMDFPEGTSVADKRDACRPQVYRYEFGADWARGTWDDGVSQGCHEIEVYPNDRLVCASIDGTVIVDISASFDDNGTPNDYTDDIPLGDPLPCEVRSSTSLLTPTAAPIIDCSAGLDQVAWFESGAPSLAGVELVGFVNHAGGLGVIDANLGPNIPWTTDTDVFASHEAELTHSGNFMLVTDESGGASIPPYASCPVPNAQNPVGNGGVHAFAVDRLLTEYPAGDDYEARYETIEQVYAKSPEGVPAVFRAEVQIPTPGAFCTAHVFQQIPGQNRIFMGWYTQGTQVVDYIEHEDGTFEWVPVSHWIPEGAIQWTSHVFDVVDNEDGTFTYYGATGDFGRLAIDVWSATLPAPAQMAATGVEPEAPEPAPAPQPAPEPEPEPLPVTGSGGLLVGAALLASSALTRRRS